MDQGQWKKKENVFYGHKHQIGAVKCAWGCVGMSDLRVWSNCSVCVCVFMIQTEREIYAEADLSGK